MEAMSTAVDMSMVHVAETVSLTKAFVLKLATLVIGAIRAWLVLTAMRVIAMAGFRVMRHVTVVVSKTILTLFLYVHFMGFMRHGYLLLCPMRCPPG